MNMNLIWFVCYFQLGDDEWGSKYRHNLEKFNVDTQHVVTVHGKSTGLAQINVAENGENQIVIIPGANDVITCDDIDKAQDVLDASKVYISKCYPKVMKIKIWIISGLGMSIGNTIAGHIIGSSAVQKWNFYT